MMLVSPGSSILVTVEAVEGLGRARSIELHEAHDAASSKAMEQV